MQQILTKFFLCGFLNTDKHTLTQLSFSTKYQRWNNIGSSTLNRCKTFFQRRFVNFETTTINICRLNFHFQPNFNIETTLVHRRWIDVILSTLFQRYFAKVETTSINVRWLNFHFQPNINTEATLMNVDDQRWFNVDVFAGKWFNVLIHLGTNLWPLTTNDKGC